MSPCMNILGSTETLSTTSVEPEDDDASSSSAGMLSPFPVGQLMMEAARKVDQVLARLQEMQGSIANARPKQQSRRSLSSSVSPKFSKTRSLINKSPKQKQDVMRIHDVLRWSDDHTRELTREAREEYLRKLAKSKTEVFSEKKKSSELHGEWKHWCTPAEAVHQVITDILVASQLAKEITAIVADCLQESQCEVGTANIPGAGLSGLPQLKKKDPMHKFKVVATTNSSGSKRTASGSRQDFFAKREALYPKSKPVRNPETSDEMDISPSKISILRHWKSPVKPAAKPMFGSTTGVLQPPSTRNVHPGRVPTKQSSEQKAVPLTGRVVPPVVMKFHPVRSPAPVKTATTVRPGVIPSSSKRVQQVQLLSKFRLAQEAVQRKQQVFSTRSLPSAIKTVSLSRSPPQVPVQPKSMITNNLVSPSTAEKVVQSRSPPRVSVEGKGHSNKPSSSKKFTNCRTPVQPSLPEADCVQSKAKRLLVQEPKAAPDASLTEITNDPRLQCEIPMEATEIKAGTKPWKMSNARATRAVLFTNPTFAPASPPGARPVPKKSFTPVKSLKRNSCSSCGSAQKTAKGWLGQRFAKARSESPDIARRILSSTRRLAMSPAKSLPALISKLPSRRKSGESVVLEPTQPVTLSNQRSSNTTDLRLPPALQAGIAQQSQSKVTKKRKDLTTEGPDYSPFSQMSRQLKDLDSNARLIYGGTTDSPVRRKLSHGSCSVSFESQATGVPNLPSSCNAFEKENAPLPGCAGHASAFLKRSRSTGDGLSISKASSAGPSLVRRAKDWMRTQTPFRDHHKQEMGSMSSLSGMQLHGL